MPARHSIDQRARKWKIKVRDKRNLSQEMLKQQINNIDVTIEFIQALIPLGLQKVNELLLEEVEYLAGKRYQHGKENIRWTIQDGSIYLRDQKIPLKVPRVRNKKTNTEVPLTIYQRLQQPYQADKHILLQLLYGISTHQYEKTSALVPAVFGLSASNLSRRFQKVAIRHLEALQTRPLDGYEFVAVLIDGKRYAQEGIMLAVGITLSGEKIILGIEDIATEQHRAIIQFMERLIERGLDYSKGLLFVVDGSKGLIKAIRDTFRECAFIQRCQWHKRENVISYLSKTQQSSYRDRLSVAYNQTTYREAKTALEQIYKELYRINTSAAKSLLEGLEETLTLHRLGLFTELSTSLKNTNCIESVISQIQAYTQKIDYWHNSRQRQLWSAALLREIEPRLRRIKGYQYLKLLQSKMQRQIELRRQHNNTLEIYREDLTTVEV